MKKKLLSLVLAGAMVASTSVSAFADIITAPDTTEPTTEVEITGKILNQSGQEPSGTFKVTIPTAVAFTVNQNGGLDGTKIKISNGGSQNIDIYAEKFVDTTKNSKISVVEESLLGTKDKTFVSLSLSGSENTVHLKSESDTTNNKGLYTDDALTSPATDDALKLTSVQVGAEKELTLSGMAGNHNDDLDNDVKTKGLSDKFTLTLKIKKSANQ